MKKSFPFCYESYIAGTAFLSRREKGAYIDLLCCQADKMDKGNGYLTLQDIKDILNGDFDCWEKIKSKFTEENGLYYNKKLESVKQGKHKKTQEEIIQDRVLIDQRINERKQQFYEECKPFLDKYPKEMLRRFYNYWIELNKSKTKMRFELERTFEISRRLVTWSNNDKGFAKGTKEVTISYKELLARFNKGETDIWEKYERLLTTEGKVQYKFKTT
jgi:hypothetical protein